MEHILSPSELTYWITKKFCIDKEIYERAIKISTKKSSNTESGTQ